MDRGCFALGVGVNENLNSLMTLKSGIAPITLFETNHDVMVGEVNWAIWK